MDEYIKVQKYKLRNYHQLGLFKCMFAIAMISVMLLLGLNAKELQLFVNGFTFVFDKELQVYCLDVGQASANFIVLPNKNTILIDTGSASSAESMLRQIDTILQKNALSEIDFLFLTHPDADHVGGTVALLEHYQVNYIYRPKVLSLSEKPDGELAYSTTYTYDNAIKAIYAEPNCEVEYLDRLIASVESLRMVVFPCLGNTYSDTNSYSPIITINYGGKNFMFTGDATAKREEEFLQKQLAYDMKIDFLFVAHHGSKYSSTEPFLEQLEAKYAIISAGDQAHPAKETLNRLTTFGTKHILCTKDVSTIAIGVNKDKSFLVCDMSYFLDIPFIIVMLSLVTLSVLNLKRVKKRSKRR